MNILVRGSDILVGYFFRKRNGLAVVEVLAVGRPGGEYLQKVGIVADDAHRVGCDVIENQVAGRIEHLHLVGICRMEYLVRLVGRKGNQLGGWVPCWIDARRDGIVALQIDLRYLAVVHDDGTSTGDPSMEEHVVGLVVLIAVAVDALAFWIVAADLVVENLCLFKRGKVALGNLHIVVHDV